MLLASFAWLRLERRPISLHGSKDYVSSEGIRLAPDIELLKTLV